MQYGAGLRAKYNPPAEPVPSWVGNGAMKAPKAITTYIPPSSIAASKGYYNEDVEAQRKTQDMYAGMGSVGTSSTEPPKGIRTMNLTMMLNGKVLGEAVADIIEENKASAGIHPIFESVDRVGDWR